MQGKKGWLAETYKWDPKVKGFRLYTGTKRQRLFILATLGFCPTTLILQGVPRAEVLKGIKYLGLCSKRCSLADFKPEGKCGQNGCLNFQKDHHHEKEERQKQRP